MVFWNECTGWGGTEGYLHLLSTGLAQAGWHVDILVPNLRPHEHARFVPRFAGSRVRLSVLDGPRTATTGGRFLWFVRYFSFLRQSIRGTWLLHFNQFSPGAHTMEIIAAYVAGIPARVSTNHLPTLGFGGLNWKGRLLARVAARTLDAMLVESPSNATIVSRLKLVPPNRLHVVLYGIDVAAHAASSTRDVAVSQLGLPPVAMTIGSMGRLVEQKGYATLLNAMVLVRKRYAGVHLLIAGSGPQLQHLKSRAHEAGLERHVHFFGHLEDLPAFLSAIDVFVLPSLFEGMPLAVLEAMAAGKGIIASAVDGIPDAIRDGSTGILVPASDPERLAQAILGLLEDPGTRHQLGAAAARKARSQFPWQRMVSDTERVYWRVLGEAALL